jgi:hypothetical protein
MRLLSVKIPHQKEKNKPNYNAPLKNMAIISPNLKVANIILVKKN